MPEVRCIIQPYSCCAVERDRSETWVHLFVQLGLIFKVSRSFQSSAFWKWMFQVLQLHPTLNLSEMVWWLRLCVEAVSLKGLEMQDYVSRNS